MTILAHVTTQQPGSRRWTEGTLRLIEGGSIEWRVVGRSIIAGQSDRTRIEIAADLRDIERQAWQTQVLVADATDRVRDGHPLCECGMATGRRCDHDGRDGWQVVRWWPVADRESHRAAGGVGRWPEDGSELLDVAPDCADALLETDGDWTERLSA